MNRTKQSLQVLKELFEQRVLITPDNERLEYQQIQVGFHKEVNFFPYMSIHTSTILMPAKLLGGNVPRNESFEAALVIRYDHADPQLGYDNLIELAHDALEVLKVNTRVVPGFYIQFGRAEITSLTPEGDLPVDWGYAGQAIVPFTFVVT
jgi:hypothetical protein